MTSILAVIATDASRIKRSSLESLSRAREIARAHDARLDCLVMDSSPEQHIGALAAFGVDRVLTVTSDLFVDALNPPVVAALVAATAESDPSVVVFASTEAVKDVLGAVAIRLGAAAIPDVAAFDYENGRVSALRPVMAAKKLARTESAAGRVLVSVRSGSYNAQPAAEPGAATHVPLAFEFEASQVRQEMREVVRSGGDAVDLAEASVVVSAGRGVKDESGRELVAALASELNAAIGATRAVVETGLYPATAQIGQTGKVVSPQLYFALGISGAIQHVAGMANSNVIVAVNKDADAPIFGYATYGVVGDLFKVVPALIEQIRAAKTA